jgi:hypothetical protein
VFPDIKKRRHILYFNQDYSKSEFITANNNFRGYKESDEVCEWLSEVFEEPCILIRSEPDRIMELNKERLPFTQD